MTESVPALDGTAVEALAKALRAVFPHDAIGDAPYVRSAQGIADTAAGSPHHLGVVGEGLRTLTDLAGGDLGAIPTDALSGILRHIEQTEFFQILLTSAVVSFYSDPEVWEALGYEGPSFDKGGYITRGFDDLAWLPKPRIEEYDGEPLDEYVPPVPGLQVSFSDTKKVATI
jgi:hypothetical protein